MKLLQVISRDGARLYGAMIRKQAEVPSRSISDRPSRSIAQLMTTSNRRLLASLSI